jgi:hypothetical protein
MIGRRRGGLNVLPLHFQEYDYRRNARSDCRYLELSGSSGGPPRARRQSKRDQPLRRPWSPWECWNAQGEWVWHFNQTGRCVSGPRHWALISGLNDMTPAASNTRQAILTKTKG